MESPPNSRVFVLQFLTVTLKQTAVVGLKQLVGTTLTGYGALEVTCLPIWSDRPPPMIILTTQLKVRSKQRVFAVLFTFGQVGEEEEKWMFYVITTNNRTVDCCQLYLRCLHEIISLQVVGMEYSYILG